MALWSFGLGFLSVIPTSFGFLRSDGLQLVELLFGMSGILRLYAMNSLFSCGDELRPRQWDPGLVELAVDANVKLPPPTDWDSLAWFIRYQYSADRGDVERAAEAMSQRMLTDLAPSDRCSWAWEWVWFEAFSRRNLQAARERESIARELPCARDSSVLLQIYKAEAAIAVLERKDEEARRAADAALANVSSDTLGRALAKAIEDDLKEVLLRSRTQLIRDRLLE